MVNIEKKPTYVIGCDQVGLPLKVAVAEYLRERGYTVTDLGTFTAEPPVDYPDYAQAVSQAVATGEYDFGVLVCGTGLGMSIAANKVKGVRAALCHDPYTAHQARAHNQANVLCMGAWVVSPQRVGGILEEWLHTGFDGGRHLPRIAKLENPALDLGQPEVSEGLEKLQFGVSLSPNCSIFGPLLFAGQLEEGMRNAAENGFDVVELSLRNPGDLPAKTIAALLAKYQLKLSAIATGRSCLHDAMCLAAADEEGVKGALARLKAFIDIAEGLHAAVILGGIRGRFTGSPEEMAEQGKRAAEAVAACAEVAAPKGVQLLIEPINRYETNFINTAEEGVQFAEEIGHPEIKLLMDTFHMNIEETDPALTLTRFNMQLGYVHFADSNRQAPGMGHLPFRQYLSTLIKNNYQGVVTAEILPLPDDENAMAQAGAFIKSLTSTVQSGI